MLLFSQLCFHSLYYVSCCFILVRIVSLKQRKRTPFGVPFLYAIQNLYWMALLFCCNSCHSSTLFYSILKRCRCHHTFTCNIVSSSVTAGNDRDREASCNGNTETNQFQRDLALIMIHGNHAVKLFLNQSLVEHDIRRIWAGSIDAFLLCPLDSRTDDINFLTSAVPILTAMRIQRSNADPRILNSCSGQGLIGKTDCLSPRLPGKSECGSWFWSYKDRW